MYKIICIKKQKVRWIMCKEAILLFLIGHFLGDYYFQTDGSVKNQTTKVVLQHSLIYTLTLLLLSLPIFSGPVFIAAILISFTHLVIDYIKYQYKLKKKITYENTVFIYALDQALHMIIILLTGRFLIFNQIEISYFSHLENLILQLQLNTEAILSWVLILLIIYKPSSISIRIVLDHFEPKHKKEEDEGITNAGALIGIFERFIILMMLNAGQLTAIGFVLTAKSVARYNKISEDPQFAEYYLLGTLLSSLLIIVSYTLIFHG